MPENTAPKCTEYTRQVMGYACGHRIKLIEAHKALQLIKAGQPDPYRREVFVLS